MVPLSVTHTHTVGPIAAGVFDAACVCATAPVRPWGGALIGNSR